MDFKALLELMVKRRASDLFITAGRPPTMKVDGALVEVSKTMLTARAIPHSCVKPYGSAAKKRV